MCGFLPALNIVGEKESGTIEAMNVTPVHYFIDAIRTVFVRGGAFGSIAPQVAALSGIAVVMNVWAVASYRKNLRGR